MIWRRRLLGGLKTGKGVMYEIGVRVVIYGVKCMENVG